MILPNPAEQRRDELIAAAAEIVSNPAGTSHNALMLAHAVTRATNGWPVFPLSGKVPAIAGGRGVLDATTDIDTICRWWTAMPGANIGGRVPSALFALDSDPRKPGHSEALSRLRAEYGQMPNTLTTLSGRLDGGVHRFYLRPPGKLSTARLGPGFDVKTSSGYVVLPPSIHPDTGRPYIEIDAAIADPGWIADLIVVSGNPATARPGRLGSSPTTGRAFAGDSIADQFSANTSWADILMPHGWSCRGNDPDADGAVWLHPNHTSNCSATIRYGQLFVWSTSTPFEASEPGNPHGYTRFRAYAVLNHGGETRQHMAAAARSLRKVA